jgi:hypothetical protein
MPLFTSIGLALGATAATAAATGAAVVAGAHNSKQSTPLKVNARSLRWQLTRQTDRLQMSQESWSQPVQWVAHQEPC